MRFPAVKGAPRGLDGARRLTVVLDRLEGVRQNGSGYKARCPAHDDDHASLSVKEGDDGRVLLHCFTGCETGDVVAAMGLTLADLFDRRPGGEGRYTPRATLQPCNTRCQQRRSRSASRWRSTRRPSVCRWRSSSPSA